VRRVGYEPQCLALSILRVLVVPPVPSLEAVSSRLLPIWRTGVEAPLLPVSKKPLLIDRAETSLGCLFVQDFAIQVAVCGEIRVLEGTGFHLLG
jgi:hypothetical protein